METGMYGDAWNNKRLNSNLGPLEGKNTFELLFFLGSAVAPSSCIDPNTGAAPSFHLKSYLFSRLQDSSLGLSPYVIRST